MFFFPIFFPIRRVDASTPEDPLWREKLEVLRAHVKPFVDDNMFVKTCSKG